MVLSELLVLTNDEDQYEYTILEKGNVGSSKYLFISDIPCELHSRIVYRILGYNAEGYDGLEVTIL